MAQATLSCPFGAIHLEDRRGTAQDGHFVSIFALPPVPPYRGRQLGDLGGYRKGAGSSADWFSLVFRCRSLGKGRELGTPLMESAFVAVGLKCGSGGRRILRRFPISVGAAHWAARGFRALHMFLQPCRGDPRGRPSEPYRFSTNRCTSLDNPPAGKVPNGPGHLLLPLRGNSP